MNRTIGKAAASSMAAAPIVPRFKANLGFPPSFIRTKKVPKIEVSTPIPAKIKGRNTSRGSPMDPPRTMAPMIEPTYDSHRSLPRPATSPTLSPTLSAIVAGFRGSSSGMPVSTLPTRSAPTSAAFVKMPPPTRANSATELAPSE
jgi:hypothetical protein